MRLRDARKARGLSQQELATKLEVSQPYVSGLESGNIRPADEIKNRIESLLAVSVEWNCNAPLTVNEQQRMFAAIEIAAQRRGWERALHSFSDRDPDGIRELTEFVLDTQEEILLPPDIQIRRTK
jgi:transcriptional regulator with XRE-family HTH domain